jgi:hypothetical protein
MDIGMDAIRSRTSIRTYDGEPLSAAERSALRAAFAEAVPGPFGASRASFSLPATRSRILPRAAPRSRVASGSVHTE